MGQAGASALAGRCCQEEAPPQWAAELRRGELDLLQERGERGAGAAAGAAAQRGPAAGEPGGGPALALARAAPCLPGGPGPPGQWGWCAEEEEAAPPRPLESLSYTPVHFDEGSTIDLERSHARYSKAVLHGARARTQRRSRAWGDWLSRATAGRGITLLTGVAEGPEAREAAVGRVPATYRLDRSLATLSILPVNALEASALLVPVDSIQVICPATEFVLLFDRLSTKLDELEKSCAVLLQYTTEDAERRRACFLEESEAAREDFVQALTAIWLERQNDHSMWF